MGLGKVAEKAICIGLTLTSFIGERADCARTVSGVASPTALTAQGPVRGFEDAHGNSVFLGIPYAATTGGANRWRAPQDPPRRSSEFNASSYSPTCPQAISGTAFTPQGEDCLSVNIWAPSTGKKAGQPGEKPGEEPGAKLPVFVYIYGGAMVTGSSSNAQLQGNNFARKGVIMVSFSMRESVFASPNSPELKGTSQNFGILDVNKAMEWIHANIHAFGGDPNRIVLGGHSSGGVQVDNYLWNHPNTWLAGAIQMSANSKSGPAYAPTGVALDVLAAEVGCPSGSSGGQLDCLRKVSIYDLETAYFNSTTNTWFTPAIDDLTRFSNYEARYQAGQYASHVPLITGNSNGEGTIFSLVYGFENSDFESWINTFDADVAHIPDNVLIDAYNPSDFATESLRSGTQYGDARFNCPVDYLVDIRSQKQNTWVYRFFGAYDNVVGVPSTAPTHGTEIPFFLGGNECFSALAGVTPAQQALADSINDWFVEWIKNPAAGPGWNKVSEQGTVAKLGVPGKETEVLLGNRREYNGICEEAYKPYFPLYPVVQNPVTLAAAN